ANPQNGSGESLPPKSHDECQPVDRSPSAQTAVTAPELLRPRSASGFVRSAGEGAGSTQRPKAAHGPYRRGRSLSWAGRPRSAFICWTHGSQCRAVGTFGARVFLLRVMTLHLHDLFVLTT